MKNIDWIYLNDVTCDFVALADASPVSLSFNVTPCDFQAGEEVIVWATAVNPLEDRYLVGLHVDFFMDGNEKIAKIEKERMCGRDLHEGEHFSKSVCNFADVSIFCFTRKYFIAQLAFLPLSRH
jgi:hypothetical protein